MSKQTEKNLFIVPSMPALYQQLLSGAASYQELGNRILTRIKVAHAFRQVEQVRELARILINIPIREFQLIAQYYLVWCKCREMEYHDEVLERIIEQSHTYKAQGLLSRGAFEGYQGKMENALYFYNEALKANPTTSEYIGVSLAIAIAKAIEGFHNTALKDLENLVPLLKYAEPRLYYDFLNSYAIELSEAGRIEQADNIASLAVSSPFGPYYPEWQETLLEVRSKRKNRSTISVSASQEQFEFEPEPVEPISNLVQFPTGERIESISDIEELSPLELTPVKLLALIIKIVSKDKLTDDEIQKICNIYFRTVMDMFADQY